MIAATLTSLMPLRSRFWDGVEQTRSTPFDAPNGNTNVTIGLVWAWHALTAQAPLTEALAPARISTKSSSC